MKTFTVLLVGAMLASGCGGSETVSAKASVNPSDKASDNAAVAEKHTEDLRQIEDLQAKLGQAEAQNKKLQATIDELRAQLVAANARTVPKDLPVRIKQREAPNGSENILQIYNLSERALALRVTMTNSTLKKSQLFDFVLEPAKISGPVKEIGNKEGWAISPGDIAELEAAGYAPQRFKF